MIRRHNTRIVRVNDETGLRYGAVAVGLDCALHEIVESAYNHIGQLVVVERQVASRVDLEDYVGKRI